MDGDGPVATRLRLLYDAANAWIEDRVIRLGAAIAYYSLFAILPVLFVSVALASVFIEAERVAQEVETALADLLGSEAARVIIDAYEAVQASNTDVLASLIGLGVLLFSATLLFVAWKDVVDIIFRAPRVRGARGTIHRRLFGVLAVFGAGALLTLNLMVQTVIAFLERITDTILADVVVRTAGTVLPLVLGALSLAILFKVTPEVDVEWRSTWLAAVVSMLMLDLGAWGYGIYLNVYGFTSVSGVLGSLFLGLFLVYYAAQILLYGVEIVRLKEQSSIQQ
jgi:membrane protein